MMSIYDGHSVRVVFWSVYDLPSFDGHYDLLKFYCRDCECYLCTFKMFVN